MVLNVTYYVRRFNVILVRYLMIFWRIVMYLGNDHLSTQNEAYVFIKKNFLL